MIAGADDRTCAHPESRHVFYPVFGVPSFPAEVMEEAQRTAAAYARILAPEAEIRFQML